MYKPKGIEWYLNVDVINNEHPSNMELPVNLHADVLIGCRFKVNVIYTLFQYKHFKLKQLGCEN